MKGGDDFFTVLGVLIDTGDQVREFNFCSFENACGLQCKIYCDGRVALVNYDMEWIEGDMPRGWFEAAIKKMREMLELP